LFPMLPVSLDCFCFVFHRLMYPMLPVSLDCPLLITPSVFSNGTFIQQVRSSSRDWKAKFKCL
jgi:hypothetical protein